MEVYLIQHAQAKPKEEDPDRALSDEGKTVMERVAAHCARLNIILDRIYHSGKLRARETAEILARHLHSLDRIEAKTGMDPLDDAHPFLDWLAQQAEQGVRGVAIVGHLPFLSKLTSLLAAGDEATNIVAFRYGGVVKLIPKPESSGYAIQWVLTPELAIP